jgi:hypothetical protein
VSALSDASAAFGAFGASAAAEAAASKAALILGPLSGRVSTRVGAVLPRAPAASGP